jgi:outer membrane protein assembly factor BamB
MPCTVVSWLVAVVIALPSGASLAQTHNADPWGVNTWHERHQLEFFFHSWLQTNDPVERLERLHKVLRDGENHDAYLYLATLGTTETVPLLLDRLRLDYGIYEPPPAVLYGFPCTRAHLIDALRDITNTDQGFYYPKWKAWWDANKDLSQRQWRINGFTAAGLHPAEPIDERFALELIGWMTEHESYKRLNASRELAEAPAQARSQWIALAAAQSPTLKHGALAVLSEIDTTGHEELLRHLAHDPDLEIRRAALSQLNERLRKSRVAPNSGIRLLRRPREHGRSDDVVFAGDNTLVVSFNDRVQAYDVATGRILWMRMGSARHMVVAGDRILLFTDDGELIAISFTGHQLWRKTELYLRSFAIHGAEVLAVRDTESGHPDRIDRIDLATGKVLESVSIPTDPVRHSYIKDIDATSDLALYVNGTGLHSLSSAPEPSRQYPRAAGLSVSNRFVCLTSADFKEDAANFVACLDPSTLTLTWSQPLPKSGVFGHGLAPVQTEDHIFVPTDDGLFAFRANDGTLEWTTQGGQEAEGSVHPTDYGLLIMSSRYRAELRDFDTGEVILNWPQPQWIAAGKFAVSRSYLAIGGSSGELWLIDLSKSGAPIIGKERASDKN